MFFRGDHTKKAMVSEPPTGWLDLLSCTETRSFDGTKWLSLSEDKSAELHESLRTESHGKAAQRLSRGGWTYDPATKRYAITIDGATTSYLLLNEEDIPGCMLVQGTLSEANLLQSWFATTGAGDDHPVDDSLEDYRSRD
jgi:hypothetical protein